MTTRQIIFNVIILLLVISAFVQISKIYSNLLRIDQNYFEIEQQIYTIEYFINKKIKSLREEVDDVKLVTSTENAIFLKYFDKIEEEINRLRISDMTTTNLVGEAEKEISKLNKKIDGLIHSIEDDIADFEIQDKNIKNNIKFIKSMIWKLEEEFKNHKHSCK